MGRPLEDDEMVVGLSDGADARAYSLAMVKFYKVINDQSRDHQIVIAYDQKADAVSAYRSHTELGWCNRWANRFSVCDAATSSAWDTGDGRAFWGKSRGGSLTKLPVSVVK